MRKLKLFSLFLMLLVGIGQMWGAETQITVSTNPTTSGTFTISAAKSSGSNAPIVPSGTTYVRCYANNVITISTSGSANMTGMTIAWTKNSSKAFASVTASTGDYTHPTAAGNGTWSGKAKSVDFTVGSSGQIQITSVTITTEDGGTPQPTPSLDHIAITGTPSNTSYEQGQSFDPAGLTVTAYYDDDSNAEVTEDVEWSFDPATFTVAGENKSVTATATYEGEEASETYNDITVTEHMVTPGEYTITFNNAFFGTTGLNGSLSGTNLKDYSGSQNDITVDYKKGTGSNMYLKDSEIRLYNGNALVVTAPTGYVITKVDKLVSGINADKGEINASSIWTGKESAVTFSKTGSGGLALSSFKVTYEAIAPEVTVDPTSLSFDAKQNIAVEGKTFTLTGANLTSGLTLAASEGFTVSPTSLTAEAAMADGGAEVTVTPATPTATTTPVEGTVTISGGGLAADVVVNLSMAVTPTYAVALAVNDNAMGSATINGGAGPVYAEYAENVTLVATANPGYEFVNWTVSTEDIDLGEDAEKANGAVAAIGAAGTITANFQAQACTGLNAPTLGEITKTYNSATIAWVALANASQGYEVHVYSDNEKTDEVASDLVTSGTSFNVADLDANTTYYFTIMGIGDGTSYCDENNTLREGNFTTSDYPSVAVTYSENNNSVSGGSKKIMTPFALPTEVTNNISGKTFVGWTTKSDFEDGDESDEETYFAKGANFTIQSNAAVTLYAVYATAGSGDVTISSTPLTSAPEQGAQYVIGANNKKAGIKYFSTYSGTGSNLSWGTMNASTTIYFTLSGTTSALTAYDGSAYLKNRSGGFEMSTTSTTIALQADGAIRGSSEETATRLRYNSEQDTYGLRWYASDKSTGNPAYFYKVEQNVSYSDYVISGSVALPVLAAPTFPVAEGVFYESTDITISAADGASIYYTTDGTTPSSTNGTLYEGAIALNAYGTYNFKAIAVEADHEDSEVAEATYYLGKTFASVSDLYTYLSENSLTELNNVKVTGVVSRITFPWDETKITYYISDNGQIENDLQMFKGAGTGADVLAVGDQVTVTGNYLYYTGGSTPTHEFGAGNTIVARTAAELASVAIGGELEKKNYSPEDNVFNRTGLTATATYNTGYEKDVTALATWTNNLTNDIVTASGNVEVTATYGEKSDTKQVAVTYTSKTLDHITLSYSSTTAYVGMALPTPTVTASYVEEIDDEDVTALVAAANGFDTENAYNGSAAGSYTINVSYTLGEVTKSAEYTVTVKAVFGNEGVPHTVADAKAMIEARPDNTESSTTEFMWVRGIVSQANDANNNKQSYYISDDGETENQLYVYQGQYFSTNANFTETNQLQVGDEVIVKGRVQLYKNNQNVIIPELKSTNVTSQFRAPEFAFDDIVAADEFEAGYSTGVTIVPTENTNDAAFTLESSDEAIVKVVDGNKLSAIAEGDAVVTATRDAVGEAGELNYKAKSVEFNVHVIAAQQRYTVTFDAGEAGDNVSGDAPETIAAQLEGAPVTIPATCSWTWANHKFTGWAVTYGENVSADVANNQFSMPDAAVTVTAQWAEVATAKISFMVGGVEKASIDKEQEVPFTIEQDGATWAPDGFEFVGWATEEQAEETEVAPTTITKYTPQAGVPEVKLYGIYSRLDNSSASYGKYVKATVVAEGDYLIVCEDQNKVFDGSLSTLDATGNFKSVTITDGVVSLDNADNYAFTLAAVTGGYSIKSKSGYYIGCTGTGNGFNSSTTQAYTNTVAINAITSSGGPKLQYYKTSGQERFRYYASNQTAIQLYKKDNGTTKYTSSPVEKVTITFDANGGEGGCQKAIINKGSELTICAEAPTKTHSEFAGWKNGDDVYEAGQAYTFDANITLTAQWNDAATYAVTYNVNGSEDAAPTIDAQYAGDQFTLAAAVAKDGYTFKGWLYNNKLYKAGKTFTMPAANVEFVANWKKDAVATEKMTLITDAAALVDGLEFALGCSYGENNFAMAGDIPSGKTFMNSVSGSGISFDGSIASFTSDVIILIAEQAEGGWKIRKDATNYLKETSQKSIAWGTSADATVWTISFSEGNVVISNANNNNVLLYNYQSPRFTTYGATSNTVVNIQMFSKATVVSSPNPVNISDLGNVSGETVVVTSGTTLVANEASAPEALVIQEGAKYVATAQTTTPVVHFSVTMGSDNPAGDETTASEIENALNIILTTGGEIHYDITLGTSMDNVQADPNQWHAFTVPFPCDALNGIYNAETGAKLTNEVDYAIMDYHGDIRANGQYGWKKFRGTLVPGTFYIMTVNGDVKTFRFKKVATGALPNNTSKDFTAYGVTDPENTTPDQGWNGIGNPSWLGGKVEYNVQVLDPYSYTFVTKTANSTNFKPGTPFFYKASSNGTMNMLEANADANYAPARTPANEIKNVAVTFGNEVFRDKLYISASEDALSTYENDKDLVKMIMSNTPKVAQIFGDAYGMKLSMVNTPLVNNNAEVALTLYAPNAGEYTISAQEMEDADLYLTQNGSIIWNLSMSEYVADFAKGNNEGYGLLLIKKAPGIATGVDEISSEKAGVQKIVIEDKVFILRGGKMYDVTGKAVK